MEENDVMDNAAEDVQQEALAEVQEATTNERTTTTENAVTAIDDDVASLVAAAEKRGYVRGRNEAIAEVMQRPGVWEGPLPLHGAAQTGRSRPVVLSHVRRSVWDM